MYCTKTKWSSVSWFQLQDNIANKMETTDYSISIRRKLRFEWMTCYWEALVAPTISLFTHFLLTHLFATSHIVYLDAEEHFR